MADGTHRGLDSLNLGLLGVAAGLAHLFPFELLVLAYVFLGPAHYLTELSWLHGRHYFLPGRRDPWLLILLSVPVMLATLGWPECALAALVGAATLVVRPSLRGRLLVFVGFGIPVVVGLRLLGLSLPLATLLLTVIHVFLFTAAFLLVGALRSRSLVGAGVFGLHLILGTSFFLWPPMGHEAELSPHLAYALAYFDHVRQLVAEAHGLPDNQATARSVMGFLSFAYSYHYLNWFSKTSLIRWHQVPLRRFVVLALIYGAAVGLYLVDFTMGFAALVALAVLHVTLEFPLNVRVFAELGTYLGLPGLTRTPPTT